MSCRCIQTHMCTLSHAHRSHVSTHSFPSYTSSLTELGVPHRAFLQTGRVLEQTLRMEPIKTPAAWVRRHGGGGWIDGAERPIWATTDFPYLSFPFFSSPPLFWAPLQGWFPVTPPMPPGATNCTSCTLRSPPGVMGCQLRWGLTLSNRWLELLNSPALGWLLPWCLQSMRGGFSLQAALRMRLKSQCGGGLFKEYPSHRCWG